MKTCEHAKFTRKKITKECLGKTFEAAGRVCSSCGAERWDTEAQRAFSDWLGKLDRNKRDRFVLQLSFTEDTIRCLDRMIDEFPGSDRAKVLRALVMFYLDRVAPRQEWADVVEGIVEREVYRKLTSGTREIVKVHFSPIAMLDIESWGRISELKPRELAENAASRILAFYIENDPVMHRFWEENIRPEISLILKAA